MTDPTETPELHVYQWGPDWWIGSSVADVIAQLNEHYDDPEWVADEEEPALLSDDSTLSIVCDADGDISDEGESVTRTCREWIAKEGRGLLASTEYRVNATAVKAAKINLPPPPVYVAITPVGPTDPLTGLPWPEPSGPSIYNDSANIALTTQRINAALDARREPAAFSSDV